MKPTLFDEIKKFNKMQGLPEKRNADPNMCPRCHQRTKVMCGYCKPCFDKKIDESLPQLGGRQNGNRQWQNRPRFHGQRKTF